MYRARAGLLLLLLQRCTRSTSTSSSSRRRSLLYGSSNLSPASASTPLIHGVHVFDCPDQVGITAKITDCLASRGASIMDFNVYVNLDVRKQPVFFARTEFVFDPLQWPRNVMEEDFLKLKQAFKAKRSAVRVVDKDPPLKIAVLVSWQDHCLIELLHQCQEGEIPVQIMCVISNHMREDDTHVIRFLARHCIPYHFTPADKENKREEDILSLIRETDFLVLARYMQILSPEFLKAYGKDIINIHHGLLPSFKGANPYRQAYEAGVKLIGATSHFVTEELDGGPIIEQMVERVSHRDNLTTFATKSEYLERMCLAKAIKYYCEMRIVCFGHKTIVFD